MGKTAEHAYFWTDEKAGACRELAARRGNLTIFLKTRDDEAFVERWITHHARIVGLEHLVIFDNMSTNPAVLDVYARYRDDLLVIQFEELNNLVHHRPAFRELYQTLAQSTEFFVFLDTDEFLVMVEGDHHRADASLVEFVHSAVDSNWLPTTWLPDMYRSETVFRCGTEASAMFGGMVWGKPVLRASAIGERLIELNHNIQVEPAFAGTPTKTNLIILHRKNLSPEQRIPSLVRRLGARRNYSYFDDAVRNFMAEGDGLQDVLLKPFEHLPRKMRNEVVELRRLVERQASGEPPDDELKSGRVRFCPDGRLEYFSEAERTALRQLIEDPAVTVRAAFANADTIRREHWPKRFK